MQEGLLWEKLENKAVRCNVCHFRCVIGEGKIGVCRVRVNRDGVLYNLLDSHVSSWALDPVEKKPLFHFFPGSPVLSFGTWGCNFRCRGCQNYEISRSYLVERQIERVSETISPSQAVKMALEMGAKGISWTYNEPVIWFEYTLETAKLAKASNLYTAYVTNGSMTEDAIDLIGPFLDAYRVDIKAFSNSTYRKITPIFEFEKILDSVIYAKTKWGVHVEIVTNIIPTVNDDIEELRMLARWIRDYLGKSTPWHVTRFYPYLEFSHIPPTPVEELEKIRDAGIAEGLNFVYVGNVLGHPYEDTYCPKCRRRVIKRSGFSIVENNTKDGKCVFCNENLNIKE